MKPLLIHIRSEIEASPEIAWDVAQDYTHFLFLHRRNFSAFEVLYDDGELQAFYYVSKPLPFLPWGVKFVSVRRLNHAARSLDQVYKSVDGPNEPVVQFHFQCNPIAENRVEWDGTYFYPIEGVLGLFPGLFARLFERRIRRVWGEDEEMMLTRQKLGSRTQPVCAPYENPVLAQNLLENLDKIENLISRKDERDVRFYDFPSPR